MAEIALAGPRLFIHRAPAVDGAVQVGSSALDEGMARRLLEHLRHDWPAMDVVLASRSDSSSSIGQLGSEPGGARCGKGRAWGERPSEVDRLEVSVPPSSVADATPASTTPAAVSAGRPSDTPSQSSSSTRLKRKRKVERAPLDSADHRPGIGRCFGVLPLVRPSFSSGRDPQLTAHHP
jgi:hypothetical protein